MSLTLDVFGILSIIIVLIQILRSVIPWIYETWIGPALVGGRLKFKEFGEWAGEATACINRLIAPNYFILFGDVTEPCGPFGRIDGLLCACASHNVSFLMDCGAPSVPKSNVN